jgi:poly(3-hydroxybutyrate) depolymerase
MLYQAYQFQSDLMSPLRLMAQHLGASLWLDKTERSLVRRISAANEVISRMRLTHARPAYGITSVTVRGEEVPVTQETVLSEPFGTLLHFRKAHTGGEPHPPVLLVAPLSGHFATLLRETARTLLQDHDVYITDWHNARDVPLRKGAFALDDYIDHMIRFLAAIGPGAHVVAVCQPCVAALAATAIMAEDDHPAQPLQPDPDGRPSGLPREPDSREHPGHRQADRVVREKPDQPRAPATRRLHAPGLPRLRAAHRLHEHEPGAPQAGVQAHVRAPGGG